MQTNKFILNMNNNTKFLGNNYLSEYEINKIIRSNSNLENISTDDPYYYDDKNLSETFLKEESNSIQNQFLPSNYYIKHIKDNFLHLGYNYHLYGILKRCLSNIFYLDSKRTKILNKIDGLFIFMVDYVKSIKRTYNYMLDRRDTNFN